MTIHKAEECGCRPGYFPTTRDNHDHLHNHQLTIGSTTTLNIWFDRHPTSGNGGQDRDQIRARQATTHVLAMPQRPAANRAAHGGGDRPERTFARGGSISTSLGVEAK